VGSVAEEKEKDLCLTLDINSGSSPKSFMLISGECASYKGE
jgi:hypothetical protein